MLFCLTNTSMETKKVKIAKMLPERIYCYYKSDHDNYTKPIWHIEWKEDDEHDDYTPVLDSEWLYICQLIERKMTANQFGKYEKMLDELVIEDSPTKDYRLTSATGEQKINAICQFLKIHKIK